MTLHIHKNILNQEKYDQEYINRELIAKSNTNDLPIFFFSVLSPNRWNARNGYDTIDFVSAMIMIIKFLLKHEKQTKTKAPENVVISRSCALRQAQTRELYAYMTEYRRERETWKSHSFASNVYFNAYAYRVCVCVCVVYDNVVRREKKKMQIRAPSKTIIV